MSKKIKLSVVVPCYKTAKYLPKCLDSLLNQTLKEIEIVAVNDGSPDDCLKILKEYKKIYGDKIIIIDKKNEGPFKGRLDGIKKSNGEYIGFLDSDDYVSEYFAEKLYNAAKNNKADIAVCGFDRIDLETNKIYSREMTKFKHKTFNVQDNPGLLVEVNTAPWNKIYKADLLKNIININSNPRFLEDMMFLELAYLKCNKITFINESLVYYMVRKGSIMNTVNTDILPEMYKAMQEVRFVYESNNPKMLDYIDANAFLHLGVSLMYRLSENKEIDFNKVLKNNTKYLNDNFPNWINNKYIKLSYIRKNKGSNKKLWILKVVYKLHMFKLFLATYKFMINHIGIDIKW